MAKPYCVDWDYLRLRLRRHRGERSYREAAKDIEGLSVATYHRFLKGKGTLDLESLLVVVGALELEVIDVIKESARQLPLLTR